MFSNKIYQTILDCVDGKGRTIIITKDSVSESRWRVEIISHMRAKKNEDKYLDLTPVILNFQFLRVTETNLDEIQILNYRGYNNLILDNVWSVYHTSKASSWITAIKTANPLINFIGISDTWGKSYMERIDQRIKDIKHVFLKDFKSTFLGTKNEDLPPEKTIHVCLRDISGETAIEHASYSFTGQPMKDKEYVSSDVFMHKLSMAEDNGSEIRSYCKVPIVIDLLSKAIRSISTNMVFSPTPEYGRRLTYVTSQLNKLFMKEDVKGLSSGLLSKNWQIDINSQKSIIFCDWKADDGLRRYVNWYAKPDFTPGTLRYAIEGFMKEGFSVLCIEGQRIDLSKRLLEGCKNVFLFGQNKYDKGLIRSILDNATDNINIIAFASKDTIDESNVLKTVDGLKDNFLTVLKHDLSS